MRAEILNGFWFVSYNETVIHVETYGLRTFEYYTLKLVKWRAMYEKANVQF
jgi:hypothetical protein